MIFEKKPEIKDYLEIAVELLDMGRNDGYITSDGLANIPELVVQANDVCKSIFYGINGQLKHAEPITIINTTLGWSAYAGIGAVYFWNEDYPALKEKGIYNTLTEKRGIDCMDEFVLDSIGMGFDSIEGKDLTDYLHLICDFALSNIKSLLDNRDMVLEQLTECYMAMYIFGMVYEMNRLGMK